MNHRIKIALTMGDPAGVGAEIVVKALSHVEVYRKCVPIVVGDCAVLEDALEFCDYIKSKTLMKLWENSGRSILLILDFSRKMAGNIRKTMRSAERLRLNI